MVNTDLHTLALTVAYNGAPFAGFAQQPGHLTVQGTLNDALALLYRRPVETTCAGRTDSGVHARGQIVSFDLSSEELAARSLDSLRRSLNALIDEAAVVVAIDEKTPGFSARFDARAREYRYYLHQRPVRPVLIEDRVWHVGKELDLVLMAEGARFLIGEHDFKSFCTAASAEGKPTHRRVIDITIDTDEVLGEEVVVVRVIGNAFLHSMVRTIVGSLVAVGLGKREPSWIGSVLEARDRQAAGENAPARGLFFWRVYYDEDEDCPVGLECMRQAAEDNVGINGV